MTLYLARRVENGVVDETSTVYLARCDDGDCRYLADHASSEVVEDALDGHRRRAHATSTPRTEDTTRTGWLSVTGPIASATPGWTGALSDHDAVQGRATDPPGWAPATDPHLPPSPTPRGDS